EIPRVRAQYPLLSDLRMRLPHLLDDLEGNRDGKPSARPAVRRSDRPTLPPQPARFGAADPLAIDPELTRRWLVEFLRDEVTRRRGFARSVVALSGGVDSAVVAYLAAEALGADQVTALRLPYRISSPDSLQHAQLVIDRLGIRAETVDITPGVDGLTG